jgi:aminopeptidase N
MKNAPNRTSRRTRTHEETPPRRARAWAAALLFVLAVFAVLIPALRSDEPYARTRKYQLQNAKIELQFDLDQRKASGQVTHTLTALVNGLEELDFDSVDLAISSVRVNGQDAHFSTDPTALHVELPSPSKAGESYEVKIAYEVTRPKKGLYFVAPDASYPTQPKEIWTQGEAEETRYYVPIYDYPNDRTTTEMVLTVPRDWVTVSNGKLVSVADASGGMKTWTWRQSEPIATYLISVVAGEFDEGKDTWRGLPIEYYVPRGKRADIKPTFAHTPDMLTFFSDRFGVMYPWNKYAQSMVDEFVEGGMENVSATTLTTRGMINPALAAESMEGADGLTSHEMTHQWFGDLVTCKDWADLWLNEGFATFGATLWEEHAYGADAAAYARWRDQAAWLRQTRLFNVPIVTFDFTDSMQYAGNIYGKAGLVIQMLRRQLGDAAFFPALQHYLEANRLGNAVTADLVKALDESTHSNVEPFFNQWIYGAGAPRFAVTSAYDSSTKTLNVTVKQTQRVEAHVGLFDVNVDIAVTTPSGTKDFPTHLSKAEETFPLSVDAEPLLVLFDKGNTIVKSVDFQKPPAEWIYQLQHADDVADRADAAVALGMVKDNGAVVAALGAAATSDRFWGVRAEALRALGRIGGKDAEQQVLQSLANKEPWVRDVAVEQLGTFRDDNSVAARLTEISRVDPAFRVRTAALTSLAQRKAPGAMETLEAATKTDSPDDVIRRAALRAMGRLNDQKAATTLLDWSAQGKAINLRTAAIGSLGQIDKKNETIESRLIAYLDDPNFDIRSATIFALGDRDDSAAIAPLEALLARNDLPVDFLTVVQRQIDKLKHVQPGSGAASAG